MPSHLAHLPVPNRLQLLPTPLRVSRLHTPSALPDRAVHKVPHVHDHEALAAAAAVATCFTEDDVRARVAQLGREAPWLTRRQEIHVCLKHVASSPRARSAFLVCMDNDTVRALALCVYGYEAAACLRRRLEY